MPLLANNRKARSNFHALGFIALFRAPLLCCRDFQTVVDKKPIRFIRRGAVVARVAAPHLGRYGARRF